MRVDEEKGEIHVALLQLCPLILNLWLSSLDCQCATACRFSRLACHQITPHFHSICINNTFGLCHMREWTDGRLSWWRWGVACTTQCHLAGPVLLCISVTYLLVQAYSTSPYCDVPPDVSACKEHGYAVWTHVCIVYCVSERWIPYLKVVSVSPLPDDATTGIVHCDAPLPQLLHYVYTYTSTKDCYTIPTLGWDDRRHQEKTARASE